MSKLEKLRYIIGKKRQKSRLLGSGKEIRFQKM
jgi:hypothetical protein